ncbi:aldo/keto reductase [Zafaria sp. J156]|uniref:aldo/keto reductase n=1 Tax=Zafaria sp. J156 TaxID=3116490 RepID=UPI002E789DEE|nr:aldo/keto reductase [Zafaria sp. J156]MEE1621875.1 aldo/keto reductase [Zafaria sp. J156]
MTLLPGLRLGDGLAVPAQGLGAMVLTDSYGPAEPSESLRTVHHALDRGIRLLDTADVYGSGRNEELLAQVLRTRRDEVVLATKFGLRHGGGPGTPRIQADPAYVRRAVDASLLRLGIDEIDLYYCHRVDPLVPIEETVAALAGLVAAGKVRHIGLSEATAGEIERAQRIHPLAAVQSEWSVFSRDVEQRVLPTVRRLGIGFVAYSPLGRGQLAGAAASGMALDDADARRRFPRFDPLAAVRNAPLVEAVASVAAAEGLTPAQTALAWVYAAGRRLGVPVVPIPGTRRSARVDENVAAAGISLGAGSIERLDALAGRVHGERARDPLFVSRGREAVDARERTSHAALPAG